MSKANKFIGINFYLVGIFSTLGALMANVGGVDIAIVNVFIAIIIVMQLLKAKLYFIKYKIPMILFFLILIISTIGNLGTLKGYWASESVKAVLKYSVVLLPLIVIFSNKQILLYRVKFFKGLRVSCYIQVFWELAQIILWNVKEISLNEIIFGQILNIQIKHNWTFISDGRFRPSGVSWEPANLALALVIGYILSENKSSKILFIIGAILSTSRTGILMMGIVVFVDIVYRFRRINKNSNIVFKYKEILIAAGICGIGLIILFLHSDNIILKVKPIVENITITIEKLLAVGSGTDSSSDMHIMYYKKVFYIFTHSNLFQIFFGYGTVAAGFPYTSLLNVYSWHKTWNPESDFITILVGNGILGFTLYYISIFQSARYNSKDIKALLVLLAITISGILYIYIRSSWTLIILIMLFVKNEDEELKVTNI